MVDNFFEDINYNKELNANILLLNIGYTSFHWHFEYEFLLVLKGSLDLYTNNFSKVLSTNEMYLLNSKEIHKIHGSADNICLCIQLSPKIFSMIVDPAKIIHFEKEYQSITQEHKIYQILLNIACKIGMLNNKGDLGSQMMQKSFINMLAGKLIESSKYEIKSNIELEHHFFEENLGEKINLFISENLTEDNLKESVLKKFGMSEKTMYRYLKTTLGITLKNLIDSNKIDKSCKMLKEDKPIAYISSKCGFANTSSFYRTFKNKLGITPNEYKKGIDAIQKRHVQNYFNIDQIEGLMLMDARLSNDFKIL